MIYTPMLTDEELTKLIRIDPDNTEYRREAAVRHGVGAPSWGGGANRLRSQLAYAQKICSA